MYDPYSVKLESAIVAAVGCDDLTFKSTMSNDKMSKDKMSKDKMSKDKMSTKLLQTPNLFHAPRD
jgi:pentapeptide MXKDX repeat protein